MLQRVACKNCTQQLDMKRRHKGWVESKKSYFAAFGRVRSADKNSNSLNIQVERSFEKSVTCTNELLT